MVKRYRRPRRAAPRRKPGYRRPGPVRKPVYKPRLVRYVGIPKFIFTKLRFTKQEQFTLTGSANTYYEYRMNSLYDPELALSTGQPYYFDQYTAMFNRYRVNAVKIEVTISSSSSTTNLYHPTVVMTPYCDSAPGWLTHQTMMNVKRAIKRVIIPGQTVTTMSRYYDNSAVAGTTKREYTSDDVFQAMTSANPSKEMRVQVNVNNNDATASITFTMLVRLTYYAKFYDEKEPAPS